MWVIGDLMLDEYVEGDVKRVSPDAPVQVVNVKRTYDRIGGAANVAHGAVALGADVELCGVIGDDPTGRRLRESIEAVSIGTAGVMEQRRRQTTRKVRVIARHQHVLRMDWEETTAIDSTCASELLGRLTAGAKPHVIVLSDYVKGVLTRELVDGVMTYAKAAGVPVVVDPKVPDYAHYRGATVIKPNRAEVEAALGRAIPEGDGEVQAIAAGGRVLLEAAEAEALVVTLGDRGCIVVPKKGEVKYIPSAAREVYDVTGAGDTFVVTLALGIAAGAPIAEAAELANAAAGIVVAKVGTAVVSGAELARALSPKVEQKVFTRETVSEQVQWWRLQGRRIVFTNGCFDLLHVGHVTLLNEAAKHGDVLVVGVNSDASVKRLKGQGRPLIPDAERAALLGALDSVGGVVVFDEDTPLELIRQVQPDVLVKGADYTVDQVVGRDVVEARGGKVVLVPIVPEKSTTSLVEKAKQSGA